ncbi:hypothetical protein [Acidovorax sp.]|uniref:hypothetical protein n=1 Tax=Acidovorax sp. TaxID=1872122 RepID=UPI00391A4EB2
MDASKAAFDKAASAVRSTVQPMTDYAKSVIGKAKEGLQGGVGAGGTVAAGVGVSVQVGTASDVHGNNFVTHTGCILAGPIVAVAGNVGYSVGTGKVTPGDVGYSLSGVGNAAVGLGGRAEVGIASDGGISVQGGPTIGGALGGAVEICAQKVTDICSK